MPRLVLCDFAFVRTVGALFDHDRSGRWPDSAEMYGYKSFILLMACLAVAGCRRARFQEVYFDMLAAEARMLEDRLYEVEYHYERASAELAACRAELAREERQAPPSREQPDTPALPEIEFPPGFENQFGQTSQRGSVRQARHEAPAAGVEDGPPIAKPAEPPSDGSERVDAPPIDEHVVAIWLNPEGTGPMDLDGRPGNDSLSVLIEPRNELDQYVPRGGQLDLVLLDPSEEGESARFARWEFDESTARRMLATSRFERGIHVRVPLPELPSRVQHLHLFVRYTRRDGQRVEADQLLDVRAAHRFAERWTPRAGDSEPATVPTPARTESPSAPRPPSEPSRRQPPAEPPEDFWSPDR